MYKQLILLFITVVICSSCGCTAPNYIKYNFTYCYDGVDTGIDTLINIEGYYDVADNDVYPRLMFYKDGTYVEGFSYSYHKSIQSQFEEIINDKKKLKVFHNNVWGRYIICGDTIKVQTVERPGCGSMSPIWYLENIWYKVIDRNTIVGIFPSNNIIVYPSALEENPYMIRYGTPAKFYPLSVRPNSDCFLKSEKWFWCNEELYKQYKQTSKSR